MLVILLVSGSDLSLFALELFDDFESFNIDTEDTDTSEEFLLESVDS